MEINFGQVWDGEKERYNQGEQCIVSWRLELQISLLVNNRGLPTYSPQVRFEST